MRRIIFITYFRLAVILCIPLYLLAALMIENIKLKGIWLALKEAGDLYDELTE